MSAAAAKRPLQKKPELSIVPVTVTQFSAFQITGMPPRRFLEFVRDRKVRHTKLGLLVVVEIPVLLAALDEASRGRQRAIDPERDSKPDASHGTHDDEGDFESADEVLAAMGRRRKK